MHNRLPRLLTVLSVKACLLVAGCGPVALWYDEGVPLAMATERLFECRVAAAQGVPANMQIGTTPIYVSPGRTVCYTGTFGTDCYEHGGNVYGGIPYSYDANAGLRDEMVARCMQDKGFARIELPVCAASRAAAVVPPDRFPALSANSCAVKGENGAWFVVTDPHDRSIR